MSEEVFLLPHHKQLIVDSQISDRVARARGYRSITDPDELRAMGFSERQCRVPCLYVPAWNVHGEVAVHFIRPDEPRLNVEGKVVKYDRPANSKNVIDVNPATRAALEDPTLPWIITEGSRKVDAGVSQGIICLGFLGVWGFRTSDRGSKLSLPDFNVLRIAGRQIIFTYDSDAITKESVYQAQIEGGAEFESRGGIVLYARIPEGPGGAKRGLDDFLQYGGDIEQLIRDATTVPVEPEDLRIKQDKYSFWAYAPDTTFINEIDGVSWTEKSVNEAIGKVKVPGGEIKASAWLLQRRSVQSRTWAPGEPHIIEGKAPAENGWVFDEDRRTYNDYAPPLYDDRGDASQAQPWVDHVHRVYPDNAEHIICWLAQRVQNPGIKINHALVLGGEPGIGKDSILAPALAAVGAGNYAEVTPSQIAGRFNGFLRSVIVRVSELRDLGDSNRFAFYEHMKNYTAAPPEFLAMERKYVDMTHVPNIVGVVYTTNHQNDGLYLPPNDRRHYVCWSEQKAADMDPAYFTGLHNWYSSELGKAHVAAYLRELDLSAFDPKAPPEKTPAFYAIVNANRSQEEGEIDILLDALDYPPIITIEELAQLANSRRPKGEEMMQADVEFARWLKDRKNSRVVAHRINDAGYVNVWNSAAGDGRWKAGGKKWTFYGRNDLTINDRMTEVGKVVETIRNNGHKEKESPNGRHEA